MSKKYNLFYIDTKSYKPFHYPSAYERYKTHEVALHWTTEEIDLSNDMKDWSTLSPVGKHIITSIFQGFVQNDTEVGMGYDLLVRILKPNEVKMMLRSFGNRESLHQDAYSLLLDTLGFPEEFYKEYEYIPSLSLKYDYIHKARVRQFHYYVTEYGIEKADIEFRKDVARMIAVYSGLIEGISLFAQFAILASFSRDGKFPGMNKVIDWSQRDESCIIEGTEVMLEDGSWKKIEDLLPGEKILQFDMETEEYSFVEPTHYTKTCPEYYYKFESDDVEQIVSPDHRMVFRRDGKIQEETAEKYEFLEGDEFIKG
jgi:ribonucleotide reductase beta subunit family protein with ferritin-like domain